MNIYPKISTILQEIENNNISFKNAIYKHVEYGKDKHFKKIYKLVIEVLKHKNIINQIINEFFESEGSVINDREFFMVLIYEKFFSDQKKKMGGKMMKLIKEKEDKISKFIKNNKTEKEDNKISESIIQFRINRQKTDTSVNNFLKEHKDVIKTDDMIEGLYSVNKSRETDDVIKQLFSLKQSADIIMQSKSSCLPAFLLKKVTEMDVGLSKESFDVIDACSAPGNKTLQLSEYFKDNNSNIYAYEINENRFNLLKSNVNQFNTFKNVKTLNEDFLRSDPTKFPNVRVILADPSCSGSGTSHNSLIDYQNGSRNLLEEECVVNLAGSYVENDQIDRLTKLAKFQIKILNHCMKFPNVKYVSYSTCSIFMTENEYVVNTVLKQNRDFILKDIHSLCSSFHRGVTDDTENTVRVCRKCNNMDGFYVAIFQRNNKC